MFYYIYAVDITLLYFLFFMLFFGEICFCSAIHLSE